MSFKVWEGQVCGCQLVDFPASKLLRPPSSLEVIKSSVEESFIWFVYDLLSYIVESLHSWS